MMDHPPLPFSNRPLAHPPPSPAPSPPMPSSLHSPLAAYRPPGMRLARAPIVSTDTPATRLPTRLCQQLGLQPRLQASYSSTDSPSKQTLGIDRAHASHSTASPPHPATRLPPRLHTLHSSTASPTHPPLVYRLALADGKNPSVGGKYGYRNTIVLQSSRFMRNPTCQGAVPLWNPPQ
jgi:hypothetical protein